MKVRIQLPDNVDPKSVVSAFDPAKSRITASVPYNASTGLVPHPVPSPLPTNVYRLPFIIPMRGLDQQIQPGTTKSLYFGDYQSANYRYNFQQYTASPTVQYNDSEDQLELNVNGLFGSYDDAITDYTVISKLSAFLSALTYNVPITVQADLYFDVTKLKMRDSSLTYLNGTLPPNTSLTGSQQQGVFTVKSPLFSYDDLQSEIRKNYTQFGGVSQSGSNKYATYRDVGEALKNQKPYQLEQAASYTDTSGVKHLDSSLNPSSFTISNKSYQGYDILAHPEWFTGFDVQENQSSLPSLLLKSGATGTSNTLPTSFADRTDPKYSGWYTTFTNYISPWDTREALGQPNQNSIKDGISVITNNQSYTSVLPKDQSGTRYAQFSVLDSSKTDSTSNTWDDSEANTKGRFFRVLNSYTKNGAYEDLTDTYKNTDNYPTPNTSGIPYDTLTPITYTASDASKSLFANAAKLDVLQNSAILQAKDSSQTPTTVATTAGSQNIGITLKDPKASAQLVTSYRVTNRATGTTGDWTPLNSGAAVTTSGTTATSGLSWNQLSGAAATFALNKILPMNGDKLAVGQYIVELRTTDTTTGDGTNGAIEQTKNAAGDQTTNQGLPIYSNILSYPITVSAYHFTLNQRLATGDGTTLPLKANSDGTFGLVDGLVTTDQLNYQETDKYIWQTISSTDTGIDSTKVAPVLTIPAGLQLNMDNLQVKTLTTDGTVQTLKASDYFTLDSTKRQFSLKSGASLTGSDFNKKAWMFGYKAEVDPTSIGDKGVADTINVPALSVTVGAENMASEGSTYQLQDSFVSVPDNIDFGKHKATEVGQNMTAPDANDTIEVARLSTHQATIDVNRSKFVTSDTALPSTPLDSDNDDDGVALKFGFNHPTVTNIATGSTNPTVNTNQVVSVTGTQSPLPYSLTPGIYGLPIILGSTDASHSTMIWHDEIHGNQSYHAQIFWTMTNALS